MSKMGREGSMFFQGYDLKKLGVPTEAYPWADRNHTGKHGYTVSSGNGAALWSGEAIFHNKIGFRNFTKQLSSDRLDFARCRPMSCVQRL